MRRSACKSLSTSLWTVLLLLGIGQLPSLAADDFPFPPAELDPAACINKDGTSLLQPAEHQPPLTDAEQLVTPDSVLVQSAPCRKVRTIELSPSLCVEYCRSCCGLCAVEPLIPLSDSGTSHLDSPLVGNRLIFRYRPSRTPLAALLAALQQSGLTVVDLATEETDLQDIFLQLTGTQAAARAAS